MSGSVKELSDNKSQTVITRKVTWGELKEIITADAELSRVLGDRLDSTFTDYINKEEAK
tara:strand:+ start:87 stop:263 length:177 start_codon:yes stop_codon:yes gene_type:complete